MGQEKRDYVLLVREDMADYAHNNRLLYKEEEFTPKNIERALDRALDRFNTTAPRIGTYSLVDFPSDSVIIDLAIYYLLRSSWIKRGRNDITYSESGNSVNDQNFTQYKSMLDTIGSEAESAMMHLKKQINLMGGFGHIPSVYRSF